MIGGVLSPERPDWPGGGGRQPHHENAGSGWAKTPGWLLDLSGIQGCWGRPFIGRRAPSPPVPPASVRQPKGTVASVQTLSISWL